VDYPGKTRVHARPAGRKCYKHDQHYYVYGCMKDEDVRRQTDADIYSIMYSTQRVIDNV